MPTEVTDPTLLSQLNGGQEVTDPNLLAQLNGTHQFGTGAAYQQGTDGSLVPVGSEAAQAANSPVSGNSFLQNALLGVGKMYTDVGLGARQIYGQVAGLGQQPAALSQEATDKRALDAPLSSTWGGKVGQVAGALPLAFVPGANTYLGAGLIGGGMGALQPTTQDDSRLLNTGVGAGIGVASKYVGDSFSQWLKNRAAEPFMGWSLKTGNQAAAQAVGSDAAKLNQGALSDAADRFSDIFGRARDPAVDVSMTGQTAQVVTNAAQNLNASSRSALEGNPEIADLMEHLRSGTANAQQLGQISSNLGSEAASQMRSQMGDRALGRALFSVQDHVDDLIGKSITDPDLAADYAAARPQYRMFTTLQSRPTILNSTTGDVNLRNLGNYLQKTDKAGFAQGGNTSPIYEAARFGQKSALGSRPSPPILQPFKWAAYHAMNNPILGAATGAVSRVGAPFAPAIQAGFPALGLGSVPLDVSYITQ